MTHPPPAAHSDSLSHLLWDLATRTHALAEQAITNDTLTLPSIAILDQIARQPGITISEIAQRTPKTSQAISQVVARLEKLDLLQRRLIDGRRIGLFLTNAGTTAHDQAATAQHEFEMRLHEAIGGKDAEQLRRLLTRIAPAIAELQSYQRES